MANLFHCWAFQTLMEGRMIYRGGEPERGSGAGGRRRTPDRREARAMEAHTEEETPEEAARRAEEMEVLRQSAADEKLNRAKAELEAKYEAQKTKIEEEFSEMRAVLGNYVESDEEFTEKEAADFERFTDLYVRELENDFAGRWAAETPESPKYDVVQLAPQEVKGRWLNDIAKDYNMNVADFIAFNKAQATEKSTPFHVIKHTNGKYYCYANDTVYARIEKPTTDAVTAPWESGPKPVVTATDEKNAMKRREDAMIAREEAREEQTDLQRTREALLSTNRRGRVRKEALGRTLLDKKDEAMTLEDDLAQALDTRDWQKFKENWKDVQGAAHIEALFTNRMTFRLQGFNLHQYMEMMGQTKHNELKFKHVLNSVFTNGPAAELLLIKIAAEQGTALDVNTKACKKFFKGLLDNVNGNFINSYDKLLDEVKFTQSKPKYLGDGKAEVTLTLGNQALKVTAPVEDLVVMPTDAVKESEMQSVPDENKPIALFLTPKGEIQSGTGVIFGAEQVEGDVRTVMTGKEQTLALIRAVETVYKDAAELYEMTGELVYKAGSSDDTSVHLRATVEGTEGGGAFAASLDSAFNTTQFEKRTREAKGLRTKKNQISWEDVESNVTYTMAKEELFKYFSGEGAMEEILDRFTHESFNEAGEKVAVFDAEGAHHYITEIFKAALLKNPDMLEELGVSTVEGGVEKFAVAFTNNELSKEQIQLLQEGFLVSMIQLHGHEVHEGEAALQEGNEHREAIRVMFSDEFKASVFDYYELQTGTPLTTTDRQKIDNALSVGFHMGLVQTIDGGVTRTNTHRIYNAQVEVIDTNVTNEVIREPGTNDSFKIDSASLGIAPINVSGLGPNGKGSFSLGFAGTIGLNENAGNYGVGVGGRYGLDLTESGLQIYADAGVDVGFGKDGFSVGPSVGGGIKIPLGVLKMDLHGHVLVGGFEVGGSLGADAENIYAKKLDKKLKEKGFDAIDQMLTEGRPNKEIAEAILRNPEFSGLKLKEVATTLNAALGLETGDDIANDPEFHQFVVDAYRARRSEFASEVLHGTSANPLKSFSIGAGVVVVGGVVKPQFHLGITVYSRSLTYRTPTGKRYGDLSDARIAEKLRTGTNVDVTDMVLRGEVPQMQLDREGEPAFITYGDSIEGILVGEQQLAEFNAQLHKSKMHLSPQEITDGKSSRTLLELKVADDNGNVEYVIDPTLKGKVTLTYKKGSGDTPDRVFLAFAPGTNLTLKRQDFHYPYKKNGAYENTVITITENPLVSRGTLTELENAPTLRKVKGQRIVADYAHSNDIGHEGNLLTLEDYFAQTESIPADERADWSRISEKDQLAREFMKAVGTVDYGEVLDPEAQTQLTDEAKRLMDPASTDPDLVAFRKEFKKISLGGSGYNPEKLRALTSEKGKALLRRELTDGELNHFLQTLTIFSFIDLHGDGSEAALLKQKEAYDKMLKGFMRNSLIREFDKFHDRARATAMADFVISKLAIENSADFNPENAAVLPEGGVFASLAGSEQIVGIRINEGYRNQDLYKILKLTSFDLHSTSAIERDVARTIVELLNPMPQAVEVTEANAKALQAFLRDDFSMRMTLLWAYKNPGEHKELRDLVKAAQHDNPAMLAAALTTAGPINRMELMKEFQAVTVRAQAAELSPTPQRVQLAENLYVSFKDVQTSFFVFQRCGNVSLYLQEKIVLENKVGQIITVMDESHRMSEAHGAEARLWIGVGAGVTTQRTGGKRETKSEEHPEGKQNGTGHEDDGGDDGGGGGGGGGEDGGGGGGGDGGDEGDDDGGTFGN